MIEDLSKSTFLEKLKDLKPRQYIVYHVGFLYSDRQKNRRLDALANEAWRQFELGYVELKQKKLGDMNYEYRAEKR